MTNSIIKNQNRKIANLQEQISNLLLMIEKRGARIASLEDRIRKLEKPAPDDFDELIERCRDLHINAIQGADL